MKNCLYINLKNGIRAEGIENWLPLFYSNKLCNIVDFFNIEVNICR